MMLLPKRPGPYVLGLLLIVLIVLVAWLLQALTSEEIREAVRKKKALESAAGVPTTAPSQNATTVPPARPSPVASALIDPVLEEKANRMHSAETTAEDDLRILDELMGIYSKARQGNPVGENEDITASLTGAGDSPGRVFPPNHPAVRNGKLHDRWGTPYWFHANSNQHMEIRSAGPDRSLFTPDDIVQNPSPPGSGASVEESRE